MKQRRKRLASFVLVWCLLAALIAGCTNQSNDPVGGQETSSGNETSNTGSSDNIKIGVVVPLSGSTALQGEYVLNGYELAVNYINRNGGVNGRMLELVVADSEGTPEVGAAAYERLISDPEIVATCGAYGSAVTRVIAPLAIKNEITLIVTHAVNDAIMAEENDYVFRPTPGDVEGDAAYSGFIEYMGENGHPINSYGAIFENADYGISSNAMFIEMCERMGIDYVIEEPVETDSTDLSGIVQKLKMANPDLCYVALGTNDAVTFARQMREYDCNIPYIGSGNGFLATDFYDKVGYLSDYMICGAHFFPSVVEYAGTGDAKELRQEYIDTYGYDMNEGTVSAWMNIQVLKEAMLLCDTIDRPSVAAAVKGLDLIDSDATIFSAYKRINFTEVDGRYNQNEYCTIIFGQFFDGEWVLIYPSDTFRAVWPLPSWDEREAEAAEAGKIT